MSKLSFYSSVLLYLAVLLHSAVLAGSDPQLRIIELNGNKQVAIRAGDQAVLQSPTEGLWSIATAWEDDWPSGWHHAHPSRVKKLGDWTILEGQIPLPSGEWLVRDSYLPVGKLIKCIRRFEWHGDSVSAPTTLSIRFQAPGGGKGILVPGVQYHGNPSGAKSGKTPRYEGKVGEIEIYEEHRLPMPFVSFEFPSDSRILGAAVHSLPSPVPFGNLPDQWWSMGAEAKDQGTTELVLLSGPCASNGKKSVVKATQRGFLPYEGAYLRVEPGGIIEKTFYLQGYPVSREGSGFQAAVDASLSLFRPFSSDGLPTFSEIVSAKLHYARSRWHESETAAGFRKYFDRETIVLGWCGQSAAPGYALQLIDPSGETDLKVQKSLDFLSTTPFYDQGFHTWYHPDKKSWEQPGGRPEILSQGQAMQNFANAIRVGRERGLNTSKWEDFLSRAGDFHSDRILDKDWSPISTNEAFFIAPLVQASSLLSRQKYLEAARKAAEVYSQRHLSMREPYWGGTLDASCEDKEGAWAALEGFLALYDHTSDPKYLDWARHAADVALTYLVVWDIDLPAGRLRNHGFKTRGWTAVSVQNQHIDVYGVLIAPSIYRLGQITQNQDLQDLAILMFRSCGQLIDPNGSQGEQPQHTNYAQHGNVQSAFGLRGGYVEDWTVFWITAHFLNAAAQFKELGVNLK